MKTLTTIAVLLTGVLVGQNNQVLNSINYLKSKDLEKAKAATDAAAIHESTKSSAKMWMYNGKVYQAIFEDKDEKIRKLDAEAEEKSLQAYINCLKLDAKENIYKDEVKNLIVVSSYAANRKAGWYAENKEFDKAINCYDLVEAALVYDFDQGMKRNNITKEKLLYSKFEMYKYAGNKEKTQEYANKLIEIGYKEPKIYTDMTKLSLMDKDTAKALYYIEKGRAIFEENQTLINYEIDIYLQRKKTDVLKEKLTKALEISPDNEVLHAIFGMVHEKTNDMEKAEASYLKALEIKPDFEAANYNLGVIYLNKGNDWNRKAGDLPPKEAAKAKDYDAKAIAEWKKAVVYLEKSYEASPDKATKQRLYQLFNKLGETEKAQKYK